MTRKAKYMLAKLLLKRAQYLLERAYKDHLKQTIVP